MIQFYPDFMISLAALAQCSKKDVARKGYGKEGIWHDSGTETKKRVENQCSQDYLLFIL